MDRSLSLTKGLPTTGDPILTAWAAACAEHALLQFSGLADTAAGAASAAIAAARTWSDGTGAADASRDAAYAAHLSARDLQDDGYHAAAICVRGAGNAAASVDDQNLAIKAADYAVEALTLNSAPCEERYNAGSERRWQWAQLPERHRRLVFATEPVVAAASCTVDPSADRN